MPAALGTLAAVWGLVALPPSDRTAISGPGVLPAAPGARPALPRIITALPPAAAHRAVDEALAAQATAKGWVTVEGRVADAEGQPVPTARIVARALGPDRQRTNLQAVAGADGRYALALPPADYRLTADAAGYIRHHHDRRVVSAAAIDFQLAAAGRVHGLVIDQDSDLPLPGATVHLIGRRNQRSVAGRSPIVSLDILLHRRRFKLRIDSRQAVR